VRSADPQVLHQGRAEALRYGRQYVAQTVQG
jgi:hypothetical protein